MGFPPAEKWDFPPENGFSHRRQLDYMYRYKKQEALKKMLAEIRKNLERALAFGAADEAARQAWAAEHVNDAGKYWFFTMQWESEEGRKEDMATFGLTHQLCGWDGAAQTAVLCIPWRQGAYLATRVAAKLWLCCGAGGNPPMPSTTPPFAGCTRVTSPFAAEMWAGAEKFHGWMDRAIRAKHANPDGDCIRPQDSDAAGGGSIEGGAGDGLTTPAAVAYAEAELILLQAEILKAKTALGLPLTAPEGSKISENMAMPDGL